jgi:hypothetical protein
MAMYGCMPMCGADECRARQGKLGMARSGFNAPKCRASHKICSAKSKALDNSDTHWCMSWL